jgi:glycerophosphoryl diester phosphodiesterase
LPELKTLKCAELWPKLRPGSARYAGKDEVLSLQEVLSLARAGCVRTARTIGVFPRIIRARYYQGLGQPVEDRLASELSTSGYISAAAAVWVQAFDPEALKAFGRASQLRRMQMVPVPAAGDAAASAMTSRAGLGEIKGYAEAICADQDLVFDPEAAAFPAPTTLTLDAHNAGLALYTYAARIENRFLPKTQQHGNPRSASFAGDHGDVDKLLLALFANGADGVSTDEIGLAAKARQDAIDALARIRSRRR